MFIKRIDKDNQSHPLELITLSITLLMYEHKQMIKLECFIIDGPFAA